MESMLQTIGEVDSLSQRVRSASKNLALALLSRGGAFRMGEWVSRSELRVLTYHRVVPRGSLGGGPRPPNTLCSDEFDEQMAFVSRRFRVVTGPELRGIVTGELRSPRYALAVTFDDGYRNNFEYAFPILRKHGVHATFFLTTRLIGTTTERLWFDRLDRLSTTTPFQVLVSKLQRLEPSLAGASGDGDRVRAALKRLPVERLSQLLDALERSQKSVVSGSEEPGLHALMSWDEVRTLASAGMTIGSHTENHQILASVPPDRVREELVTSRKRIEEETGQPCWCFAYPNGGPHDFRNTDERAVREAGYLCAFTQTLGTIGSLSARFALPRIPVPDSGDLRVLRLRLSGIQHLYDSLRSKR